MNIKRIGIRFNLDKEADRKAYEYLQRFDKKKYKLLNRFVISLVAEYVDKVHKEQSESEFINRVISAIREELKANISLNLLQLLGQAQQSVPLAKNTDKNDDEALDFINGLSGNK